MSKESVTIRDVAARAGVSKSTVSKYLTATPYVSDDARSRIEEAIRDLGYRPNSSARALVSGRTRYLGVLVPSIANPYQADLLGGIERAAAPRNLGTLLAIADDDAPLERSLLTGLLNSGADGLIVSSAHSEDAEVLALRRAGIPVVLAGRHLSGDEVDYVVVDNIAGAQLAVEHLIGLGHCRIAHVGGPTSVLDFAQREQGFRRTMGNHDLVPMPAPVPEQLPSPDYGRQALRAIVDRDERPTAVFASVDWIALGMLAEANRIGLAVPGDLSIIGFDNFSYCELAPVPLTTIDARPTYMGERAVDLLDARISAGYGQRAIVADVVEPTLVVRASTGAPKSPSGR